MLATVTYLFYAIDMLHMNKSYGTVLLPTTSKRVKVWVIATALYT